MSTNTEVKTILVVDDDDDTRLVVRWRLEDRGYKVIEAAGGREAVEAALGVRPDLILMDLVMPIVDGVEAVRQVKEHPQLRDVPVVVVTARDVAGSRAGAEFGDFDDYLSKPFDFLRLNAIIEKLFSRCHPRHFADP
ncbi:MAG: response regulator [Acidobacteriota bacterium]|nr:response regulator [Acidobacteriota bacterium]